MAATGSPRLLYACPAHRDWTPTDDGGALVVLSHHEIRALRMHRAAMVWMLHQAEVPSEVLARLFGLNPARLAAVLRVYETAIDRRHRASVDWTEPWARRLRDAGAIPASGSRASAAEASSVVTPPRRRGSLARSIASSDSRNPWSFVEQRYPGARAAWARDVRLPVRKFILAETWQRAVAIDRICHEVGCAANASCRCRLFVDGRWIFRQPDLPSGREG